MDTMNSGNGNEVKTVGKVCNCPHHKAIPVIILLIGLVILLSAFNLWSGQAETIVIGLLVIIAGFVKLKSASCKCC